jgi:hypothetical protein
MPKKSKPSLPFEPLAIARDAGAATSGWWKLGDGAWYGTVVDKLGIEWEVEELKTSWTATSSTSLTVTGSSLEELLKKALR